MCESWKTHENVIANNERIENLWLVFIWKKVRLLKWSKKKIRRKSKRIKRVLMNIRNRIAYSCSLSLSFARALNNHIVYETNSISSKKNIFFCFCFIFLLLHTEIFEILFYFFITNIVFPRFFLWFSAL